MGSNCFDEGALSYAYLPYPGFQLGSWWKLLGSGALSSMREGSRVVTRAEKGLDWFGSGTAVNEMCTFVHVSGIARSARDRNIRTRLSTQG